LNQAEFDKQEQEKQKLIDEALTLIDSLNMYSQEISNNLTSLKEIVENQKRIFRDDPEVTNACKEFNLLLKEKSL
jgi:TRAP-type mannitol/chloroaromatic compound transport system substrate-binding protein